MRDDVALSHSCKFGRQFMAYRSFHKFLVYIARLPHHSLSGSSSSMSMMYHKQFPISRPCAAGLCGELCSWLHAWMHHDSRHSDRFILSTNRSIYDSYDITHSNSVSILLHWFSLYFLNQQQSAIRSWTYRPSWSLIWILDLSHGAFDPCTCTDEFSCLTIWSLKSRKSWRIAKLVHKLHCTEIWRWKYKFVTIYLRWRRSHHLIFVRIRYLYGD